MRELATLAARQLLLFTALLTPLELLWPARPQQTPLRRGLVTDGAHLLVNALLMRVVGPALLAALGTLVALAVPVAVRAALGRQPWALQLVEIVLTSELATYWVHRCSHTVPWLWRFHAVHHGSEQLDWVATHRQHPLDLAWRVGIGNLPALLLGFSFAPLYAFIVAQKLYTAWLHANVRVDYGRLGRWLASPRFHHWHHDRAGAPGRNFASLFPWVDRLFGSYELPAGFPRAYGCDANVPPGWLGQLLWPLRRHR
jgi:sterol desaturase/sphingolipid hydroxylase (fatty acid hydroxylase superfamily)